MTLSVLNERKDGKFTVQFGFNTGRTIRKILTPEQLAEETVKRDDHDAALKIGSLAGRYAKMPNRGAQITMHNGIVGDGYVVVAVFSTAQKAKDALACYFDCIDTKDILTTWKLNAEVK